MANRIPPEFLDQLLSRVDLVEVVDARVNLRKAGREFVACCPFHAEKTPSFSVSPSKQFYHCFGCGAHGSAISFLMEYEHLSFLEAVEELARSAGLELPRGATLEGQGGDQLIALVEQADSFFRRQLRDHPTRQKAVDYLKGRGLNAEVVNSFGIGYAPPGWDNLIRALQAADQQDLITAGLAVETNGQWRDRFRDRITFPIRDRRGRTIAFGARTLGDGTPKYLNSPETPFFHKGHELYGLFEARTHERRLQRLLVVEGYMDVVALAQHGIHYAVATLGTSITAEQVEKLFRVAQDVVFCFDGDRAGREAAWRALENTLPLMRDGRQVGFLFLPDGEDPDSLVRKEGSQAFAERLPKAQPLSSYFFERLSADINMQAFEGHARFYQRAHPLLEKLPAGAFRDMMSERLQKIANKPLTRLNTTAVPQHPVDPTRSPVRMAITLLLQRTDLARQADDLSCFHDVSDPGLALLVELIELLQARPHLTVAALLERYRDTETGRILERLAQWHPPPTLNCEDEFAKTFAKLSERYSPLKKLLDKLARGELKNEEKPMLQDMLRNFNKTE